MASSINVNQNNNNVSLQDNNRRIIVTDNNAGTTTNVTQPVTSIVTISALGPQGAQGPQGQPGEIPSTGSFVLTSSFNAFTSSYYVDSGSFSTRVTNLEDFSSSLDATFATDAELNAATASLSASISYLSSSFETFSGSYNTGSFTGSFTGDGSQLTGIVSSKWTGSNPITREGNVEITGSLIVSGSSTFINIGPAIFSGSVTGINGFTGSLLGTAESASYVLNAESASYALTASYAANVPLTASYALTASYIEIAQTSSYYDETDPVFTAVSGTFVLTSSFDQFTSSYTTGSFTGSFQGDGSQLTGIVSSKWTGSNPISRQSDVEITGSLRVQGSITGSLLGTASFATSASYALTSSFAQTAQTASYVLQAVSASFATSASFSTSASFAVSASRAVTASLALTASFVTPLVQNVIITGSLAVTQNITGSRMFLSASSNMNSGSTLYIYGSGSTQPVFTVQGSSGELFSVTDSLSGSLFSVNDISGLPILEVFSDNTTLIGNYLDPMLITTAKVTQTNSGSFVVYSLPTASYDTAFFEYSVKSGSNARAGTIMAIQSGSSVNFTETITLDFGSTTAISFVVVVTGSNMALTGSSTTGSWTIKSIVRGI